MKFRKFTLVLLSSLSFAGNALAHNYDTSIVIGPNFSQHSIDSATLNTIGNIASTGVGYGFGSFLGFDFSEVIGMELGFLFIKRTTSFPLDINYNTTIMNIPVLLRFAPFADFRGLKVEVGPYLGIFSTASLTRRNRYLRGGCAALLDDHAILNT